jgi:hypothetical protein
MLNPLKYFAVAPFNEYLIVLIIWSVIWKGIALWKSARNNQKYWFVGILVLNTLGIIEIIYIKFFQKKAAKKQK